MMGVLYIRDGRAAERADPEAQAFFYTGRRPRLLYRLRLGMASLLTTEAAQVARLRAERAAVVVDVIPVDDDPEPQPGS
jgi:hypothetical protein